MANLYALRAHIDALIAAEEAAVQKAQPVADPAACPKCGASKDDQVVIASMTGVKTAMCQRCKESWVVA